MTAWVFLCMISMGSFSGLSVREQFLVVLPTLPLCEAARESLRALKDAPVEQGLPVSGHCTLRLRELERP